MGLRFVVEGREGRSVGGTRRGAVGERRGRAERSHGEEAGCGVTARVMDADVDTIRNGQAGVVKMAVAKKLEGDVKDPISRGGLCARGQASIQITYHPDRMLDWDDVTPE